jgi:hypothetical protein
MNKLKLLSTLAVFSAISVLYLSSCKDDDDPAPRAKVSFSSANITVNENQGSLPVTVELDRAAAEDVVVEYSISGTATRRTSTNTATADYEITGTIGEVKIPKGQTSATINIGILNANIYEEDETIILTIEDVDSDRVDFGERTQLTITIVSDDAGLVASFQTTTFQFNEGETGFHEIFVTLDQAPASDVIVTYQLSQWLVNNQVVAGIAIDSLSAFDAGLPPEYYDYYIDGTAGQLTIPAGETSAAIRVNVLSDFLAENTETIEITLIATPGITPGTANKATISVIQEDGRIVALYWPEDTDADMDLWVWFSVEETEPEWIPFIFSVVPGTNPPEQGIIPENFVNQFIEGGFDKIDFGISAIYYSGTTNPLDFETILADINDGVLEPADQREITEASYGLNNINEWDNQTTGTEPIIIQTFSYTGGAYTAASGITVPDQKSRIGTVPIPKHLMNRRKAPFAKQFNRAF